MQCVMCNLYFVWFATNLLLIIKAKYAETENKKNSISKMVFELLKDIYYVHIHAQHPYIRSTVQGTLLFRRRSIDTSHTELSNKTKTNKQIEKKGKMIL